MFSIVIRIGARRTIKSGKRARLTVALEQAGLGVAGAVAPLPDDERSAAGSREQAGDRLA